jgi:hypothetical protein
MDFTRAEPDVRVNQPEPHLGQRHLTAEVLRLGEKFREQRTNEFPELLRVSVALDGGLIAHHQSLNTMLLAPNLPCWPSFISPAVE